MARVLSLSLAVPRVLLHRQSGMYRHVVRHPWCPRLRLVVRVRTLQRYNSVKKAVGRRSGTNAPDVGINYSQLRSSTFPATVPQAKQRWDGQCLPCHQTHFPRLAHLHVLSSSRKRSMLSHVRVKKLMPCLTYRSNKSLMFVVVSATMSSLDGRCKW